MYQQQPMTDAEARLAEELLLTPGDTGRFGRSLGLALFGGVPVGLLAFMAADHFLPYHWVIASGIATGLLATLVLYRTLERRRASNAPKRPANGEDLRSEIREGQLEVATFRPTEICAWTSNPDAGVSYALRLEDGSVVVLQWLYPGMVEEEGQGFPGTEIQVCRLPRSKIVLLVRSRGEAFPAEKLRVIEMRNVPAHFHGAESGEPMKLEWIGA